MRDKGKGFLILFVFSALFFVSASPLFAAKEQAAKETALAAKSIAIDTNADSKPDRWEYYDKGELVRIEADTNTDGKVDEWAKVKDGKIVSAEKDSDYDGKIDRWIDY